MLHHLSLLIPLSVQTKIWMVDMLTKAERKAIKQKNKQEMKEQKAKAKARKREAKHGAPTSAEPLSKNE